MSESSIIILGAPYHLGNLHTLTDEVGKLPYLDLKIPISFATVASPDFPISFAAPGSPMSLATAMTSPDFPIAFATAASSFSQMSPVRKVST